MQENTSIKLNQPNNPQSKQICKTKDHRIYMLISVIFIEDFMNLMQYQCRYYL